MSRWRHALGLAFVNACLASAFLAPVTQPVPGGPASLTANGCPAANGDAYSVAVLADAPVAYYRLDEPTGTTLCDSSTAANNGTYNATGVTYGVSGALTGDTDTAVSADGSTRNAIGTSGANTPISGNSSFTLEGWFRKTTTTQNQALVDIGSTGLGNVAGLTTWTSVGGCTAHGSSIGLDLYTASNCWDTNPVGVNLFDGRWHYVAITYDSAQLTGYADGQSLGSQTPNTPSSSLNLNASPVHVGWWQPDTSVNHNFIGAADEVAVYSSALSASRVAAHWAAATTATTATPTIATTQQPASAAVGSSVADQATVTNGSNPTGTVTFKLYNNSTGTGTALFTDTEPLVSGSATSKGFATTATGTDYWVATYNGDSNNNAVTSATNGEPVTITKASPSIVTTQHPAAASYGSAIADQATVSGGYSPTGTVTFNLYSNASGTGTPLFTDTETLVTGSATSTGYTTSATGTDYWVATYNGDSNNNAVTSSTSSEPVTVTITPEQLCLLTWHDAQGSPRYAALPPLLKQAANLLVTHACAELGEIIPRLTAAQKAKLVTAYDLTVDALVRASLLTPSQATTLKGLAATL